MTLYTAPAGRARKISPAMTVRNIEELNETLPREGRLMALDLGTKTIGVALSDVLRTIATPRETIARKKFGMDAAKLVEIIHAEEVAAIILGLPVNMDGTEGPRAQSTRQFAVNLSEKTDIDIAFWDERLSTAAVTRTMIEADLSRARRKEVVDKMAAAYILQGALDYLKRRQHTTKG